MPETRDFSVYPVWIVGEPAAIYAKVKALDGVLGVGRPVACQRPGEDTWQAGQVVDSPADGASQGGGTIWIALHARLQSVS